MNRREWIGLCGWGLFAAAPEKGNLLVDTPARRAEYLRSMLQALCTGIGPRPTGSKAFDAGTNPLKREMERSLPSVSLDTFTFRGWEPVGAAEMRLGDRRVETYLAENSPWTSADGVRGKLQKDKVHGYAIIGADGSQLAHIEVSEFGRAITQIHRGGNEVPLFNIGKQDAPEFDGAIERGTQAWVKAEAKWLPGATASNVVGALPGTSKDEILIVAHADTKYNTPGANDNTASLICLLMLAHALSAKRHSRNMTFLATAGEERGYMGAKHYASTRKQKGTLGHIKVCINLDSLTYGPNLQIATTDSGLEKMILDIHRDLHLTSQPKVIHQNDTMDSAPFLAGGARTVHLNSRGDDARTLPLWHRPEDLAGTIKPEFIESSFLVLSELCTRLQALPTLSR